MKNKLQVSGKKRNKENKSYDKEPTLREATNETREEKSCVRRVSVYGNGY